MYHYDKYYGLAKNSPRVIFSQQHLLIRYIHVSHCHLLTRSLQKKRHSNTALNLSSRRRFSSACSLKIASLHVPHSITRNLSLHHILCQYRTMRSPYLSLFLLTIFISNLFELFFRAIKIHSISSLRHIHTSDGVTLCIAPHAPAHHNLEDLSTPHTYLLFLLTIFISNLFELFFLRQKYAILAPLRRGIVSTDTRAHSLTCLFFCSLFLFQICLNYFFAIKIHYIAQHQLRSISPMVYRFHHID